MNMKFMKMKCKQVGAFPLTIFLAVAACGSAFSEDIHYSDFLTDYSKLQQLSDQNSDQNMRHSYLIQGAEERMASYTAIIVDQPEIFVASDSKYKGMKPDDMKALADAFRTSMTEALAQDYMIVEQAGPNVLYVRFALSNLQLKKKKKGLLSFTPIGLVAGAAKSAMTSDFTKKIDLKGLTLEIEVLDSISEQQLAAALEVRSSAKKEPALWAEVQALLGVYGERMRCRLNNSRMAEESRVDCLSDM
jgi:hypothetical protein